MWNGQTVAAWNVSSYFYQIVCGKLLKDKDYYMFLVPCGNAFSVF